MRNIKEKLINMIPYMMGIIVCLSIGFLVVQDVTSVVASNEPIECCSPVPFISILPLIFVAIILIAILSYYFSKEEKIKEVKP